MRFLGGGKNPVIENHLSFMKVEITDISSREVHKPGHSTVKKKRYYREDLQSSCQKYVLARHWDEKIKTKQNKAKQKTEDPFNY